MSDPRQSLGKAGEELAERYLKRQGYAIVERNYRCPLGEIDLIALDKRAVVFVEVKTRRVDTAGAPLESVNGAKQQRLKRAAMHYLNRHHLHDRDVQFDVVGISLRSDPPAVRHVRRAFDFSEP
ncbi:MAG: YraN family protein [Deltaproteobacteria bacterium]|nr:YraN family protein [Deltaproteobacteria bacterium]